MKIQYYISLLLISFNLVADQPPKIIGLVAGRNEERLIKQCLKALSLYADAIVYLDDCSTDKTLEIVQSLEQECRIERIITKEVWVRDEPGDRNRLLQAGREIGGTHFIFADADEMFSANCMHDNFIRTEILKLQKGEKLVVRLIDLWRSPLTYRIDRSSYANRILDVAFCDDGVCYYEAGFIHASHSPQHRLAGEKWVMDNHVVLHFAFVNWHEVAIKYAWYKCLERIRMPEKPIDAINYAYNSGTDENGMQLVRIDDEWLAGYDFFDAAIFDEFPLWRAHQIAQWIQEYGDEYFAGLGLHPITDLISRLNVNVE